MSRPLPRVHTEIFTIEFNCRGNRQSCKVALKIDLHEIRRTLGKKAALNGGRRSKMGAIAATVISPNKYHGLEDREKGTVCYE